MHARPQPARPQPARPQPVAAAVVSRQAGLTDKTYPVSLASIAREAYTRPVEKEGLQVCEICSSEQESGKRNV
jgi:hypothetical protein